jgi:hypothetical protein
MNSPPVLADQRDAAAAAFLLFGWVVSATMLDERPYFGQRRLQRARAV